MKYTRLTLISIFFSYYEKFNIFKTKVVMIQLIFLLFIQLSIFFFFIVINMWIQFSRIFLVISFLHERKFNDVFDFYFIFINVS